MPDLLTTAIGMHQTGQLSSADRLYRQVLANEAGNADALHLLGVLRHQQGHHAEAIELIGKAVALRPTVAAFHANLAEPYRALGQLDRAAGCCRVAIRLQPIFPEANVNLALVLRDQGHLEAAVAQLQTAIRSRPDFAAAHNNLGDVLRVLGKRQQAVHHFREAVRCDPRNAFAHSNLGLMLLEQQENESGVRSSTGRPNGARCNESGVRSSTGRPNGARCNESGVRSSTGRPNGARCLEEALFHCRQAVQLRPDCAEGHNNLGNVLRARDQLTEARACYAEALRLNPDLALTYGNMGQALQQDGQLQDAIVWYEQGCQLQPDSARLHCYLGSVYEEQENSEQAVARYELALRLDPKYAEAHNRLGRVRQEQGQLTEAREHYQTALALQPDFPAARCNLGEVLQELGDLAGSEREYRAVLCDYPRHAAALTQLATLLRGKLPESDRLVIEQRLGDPDLTDASRSNLLFGLAHVCDARGDYDRAAAHLHQANALTLALRNNHNQRYDPAAHARFVEQMIDACTPAFFQRLRGLGQESEQPVFIVGLPRSGTTLTEQVLAGHSQVFGAGELRLAREDFLALGEEATEARAFEGLARLEGNTLRPVGERHLEKLRELNGAAVRVVDKMPDNYLYLGLLATLFPRAKFIHCRRDVRDVAVSCWMTHFRSILWANDPEHIAARFAQYRRLMEHWRAVLPVPMLEVDYEETVADLEGVARRLLDWCGLAWEPGCLAFHETKRPVRTASVMQVRQPLYRHAAARWKNYENTLAPLLQPLHEPTVVPAAV